ncbi:MAG TPA: hypothetical protein VFK89_12065 [Actinomycetota bacterium]|nr:hypothetical protein [Actinomycetota bacterium]
MDEVRLGDVIERVRRPIAVEPNSQYLEVGVRSHGKGIFHKEPMRGVELGAKKVFAIEPGDLVFNIVFAWEGAVAVAGPRERGMCGSHRFPTYRPLKDSCDVRYLAEYLLSPRGVRMLGLVSPGSAGRNRTLNQTALLDLRIPLPSMQEQRRIIDLLLSMDDARDRASHVAMSAEAGGLAWDSTSVPADHHEVLLGDIAEVLSGVTKDARRQADPAFVEVPYLRVANVQRGYLDLDDVATIRVPEHKVRQLQLQPGDILFNEGGDRDKLGRGWVWEGQLAVCIHQNHVLRARLRDGSFDPRFVAIWANSYGRAWFERMGTQTTNLASLNLSTLKRFPVPAVPLAVQLHVAEMSEAFRQTASSSRAVALGLVRLRAAIRDDLLTGMHRIPSAYDRLLRHTS